MLMFGLRHRLPIFGITYLLGASYPSFALLLCGLTLATLPSRLHLGLHYLSDIVAGLVIGLALALGVMALWGNFLSK